MQLLVVVPKPDGLFPDPGDAALRDGRTSYIATGVLQEMPFVPQQLRLRRALEELGWSAQ
jgi:hypothetical protein